MFWNIFDKWHSDQYETVWLDYGGDKSSMSPEGMTPVQLFLKDTNIFLKGIEMDTTINKQGFFLLLLT